MVRGFAEASSAWLAGLSRRPQAGSGETMEEGGAASVRPADGVGAPVGPAQPGSNRPAPVFASTGPHGHRRRMRERLLGVGATTLADYEILEMLLFLGIPRRDTKPLAKGLINEFGSLAGVLSAEPGALGREGGLNEETIAILRLPELAAQRLAGSESRDRPVLNSFERLHDYFDTALTGAVPGQLRVLFLDNRNRLLADEVVEDASAAIAGLESAAPDPSRGAMRRALDLHSTAMIMVRILQPGPLTKAALGREAGLAARMTRAATPLAIILHDHLLIGGEDWVSLKQKGLL